MAVSEAEVAVCGTHRGKLAYESRPEARLTMKRMIAVGRASSALQVYKCSDCGFFFIGGALPKEVKLRLRRQGRLRASTS